MGLEQIFFRQRLEQSRELVQDPTWYLEYHREQQEKEIARTAMSGAGLEVDKARTGLQNSRDYLIYKQLLTEGVISLGRVGQSEPDEERKEVDRIIIHHTKRPRVSKNMLSAMELIRLYVPEYAKLEESHPEYHMPIYSGHFHDGKQVFWPYHWFVNGNGEAVRLLGDNEIGWHAGDWDMNTRSVAIAVNQNLEHRHPSAKVMVGLIHLIRSNYPDFDISSDALLGHDEVNPQTTCPGNKFHGPDGWKISLLDKLAT